jgi:16S rRNA G527 N7-methylase RsmG
MHPARIAELLHPFLSNPCHSSPGQRPAEEPAVLSLTQLQHISTYIDILIRWNARINLTAIRNEDEIVSRHFGESLFAARHLFPATARVETGDSPLDVGRSSADWEGHDFSRADSRSERNRALASEAQAVASDQRPPLARPQLSEGTNARLADLGSGPGFPGIPIKLWAPNIALTLIESNQKKATFLREVARALTLTDINIQSARAETLPPSTFDVVTLRAVERFAEALPTAATLLAPAGRLALLISDSQPHIARSTLPTLAWDQPIPIPQSQSRVLLTGAQEPRK